MRAGLTHTQARLISSRFSGGRRPAPAFAFLSTCRHSSPLLYHAPKALAMDGVVLGPWWLPLVSAPKPIGKLQSLFGAEATWDEEDKPTFLLSPPSQWAVGCPGHQPKPACGLSTAHAQMPESGAPISAFPPGLCCLLQVGSSWRRSIQDGGGSTEEGGAQSGEIRHKDWTLK